jgi:DNA topoisomerase-1
VLKELGAGANGAALKVLKGRYGPYVSDGETNATISESLDPMTVTLEQAQHLIAERVAKGGGKKKKKKAAPKPKAEKPPEKKAAPKKKTVAKKKPEPVAGE